MTGRLNKMNRENKAFRNIASALETLFLALAGLYLIYRISKSTTFHLVWPSHFETILIGGMAVLAVARLLTAGAIRWKTLAALALALVYGLVYRNDGYSFLLFLAVFTVGFIDIDYRKILRVYLLAAGAFYAITMVAGMLGVITNYVSARAGRGIRSAWGMSYYTDFASLGLFLLMSLWIACRKLPGWGMLALCGAYLFLSACIAHSNTSTFCAGLLGLAILYHGFERRVIDHRPGLRWMKKGPELFAVLGFPLLALLMFFLMLLYAKKLNIGFRLNNLLSNRLMRGVAAWRSYGIKPFGTPFEQHGNGFSTFPSNSYNFVDSTYPLVLLRYGWVTLLALCLSWGHTALKARRCGDRRLLLVMGIIAVHAFSEHHFIDSHFNILVTMPLAAYMAADPEALTEPAARKGRNGTLAWTATALLFAAGAFLAGPMLLSRIKTTLELMHYGHGTHVFRLACLLGVALLVLCLAAWAMSTILKALLERSGLRPCLRALAALMLSAFMGGGAWLYSGRVIDRLGADYVPTVESERRALEVAVGASSGKVFSGVLPALYSREIDGMACAAWFEDDLARLRGNTILMASNEERGPFIDNGFLYVPISDEHALYTGDRGVIEALREAGYAATGYYSSVRSVDLESAAASNGLAYSPERGLELKSDSEGMINGPWQDLYGGNYTVVWDLALPEGVQQPEDKLCTLRVSTYKGDTVVAEKDVRAKKFDADGLLTLSMRFRINDSRNVAFEARAAAGATVEVRGVRFMRTPDYDVHTFYDEKLRKVRDEYYGTDGQPILRKEGWFACDFDYDRHGNITSLRYYDCDGVPTLIREGYAERRRSFDARNQVLREEYYGTDGQPILSAQGCAASAYTYDDRGNVTVLRHYGLDGTPVLAVAGYARVDRAYDEANRVIQESYYGVDDAPIRLAQGQCGVVNAYDSAGNLTMRTYLDAQGQPTLIDKGYASFLRVYNSDKKLIREEYYGTAGELVTIEGGYAAQERDYDEAGNNTARRYFGPDGAPVKISKGYAEIRYEYNDKRKKIRESYYGIDGQPINRKKKFASVEYEYNATGKLAMKRYYDKDGKLVREVAAR